MKKKEFCKQEIINSYILKKESVSKIAKSLNVSRLTLSKWMVNNGIKIDSHRKYHNKPLVLSKEQEDILFGGLLGDASLTNNGRKNTNAQLLYVSSNKDHVEFFHSFFKDTPTYGIKESKYFDERTNKTYVSYVLRSSLNKTFTEYRDKWYVNNIKTIPKDLKLNSKICLVWYLGDGSIQQCYKERRTDLIKLSTNCFNKEEIKTVLIPQLKEFAAYVGFNEKNQPIIRIPRKGIKKFLKYIGDCPVKSYQYKWKVFDYKYNKYEQHEIK